jgi:hypothetical protein
LAELREIYTHHIAVEDREVFPLAGRVLDAQQLAQVGREMAQRRGLAVQPTIRSKEMHKWTMPNSPQPSDSGATPDRLRPHPESRFATPGALEALASSGQQPMEFLARHVRGDWGDVCAEDRQANDRALQTGERLVSAYHTKDNQKIWVITEADRSSTCVLLPSEY